VRWREPFDAVRVVRASLRDAWDALVALAPLNLAWLGLSLTVVLLPPATAALFESMHELAGGSTPGITDFLAAVRRRFVVAWLWAVWAVGGLALLGSTVRLDPDPSSPAAWLSAAIAVFGILFIVSLLYVWPFFLLQREGGIVRATRNSILAVLAAPLFALSIAVLLALLFVAGTMLILPLAVAVPGIVGLVASHAVRNRLRAFGKLPPRPAVEDAS